ncbi:MAG TPA: hypothetical protein VKN14_10630 [Flavobacteriaceae bacterium]|nr:hypothetical protein [Flavobacteriaceae bacterium]
MKQLLITIMLVSTNMSGQNNSKHVFYLHGMIIEIQGIHAVSETFGEYRYHDIIDALKNTGATVHHEVRTHKTDFNTFCKKISSQIDSLIANNVNPKHITVIGASKGAIMTMTISSINKNPINYVLLGANSDYLEKQGNFTLHGCILGIYEKTDTIAGKNYQFWIDNSKDVTEFKQLEINIGLSHGFLYRPYDAWLQPAKAWMGIQ